MSKSNILNGELNGIMKNLYGSPRMCWNQLCGPEYIRYPYPRDEAEIAQVFSVTCHTNGKRWMYATVLENLYCRITALGGMFCDKETHSCQDAFCKTVESNNDELLKNLNEIAKPCFCSGDLVFSHSPVCLYVYGEELLAIGNGDDDCWLDMADLKLKSRECIDDLAKKKSFNKYFGWLRRKIA